MNGYYLRKYCIANKFQLIKEEIINPIKVKDIINKLISPPIIGCFIGIIIGLSSMKDILFSSNHYIDNVYYVLYNSYKAYVPLLFLGSGVSLISRKGLNINMSFSKFHIILSIIVKGLIFPLIGIEFVKLWVTYYGGDLANDKVLRFAMFIPWALPSSPNFTMIVTILQYYKDEHGLVLMWHNALIFVTLTIMLFYILQISANNYEILYILNFEFYLKNHFFFMNFCIFMNIFIDQFIAIYRNKP